MALTERQRAILNIVAQLYIQLGAPVSSKTVAELAGLNVSSSTVRNEFAVLEDQGYLTHPHTSAGRMPTTHGYRKFVDSIMGSVSSREVTSSPPVALEQLGKEIDVALQQTSESMSQATNLLALVVSPRVSGTRVRHVELLLLQPNLVMVVFILSTGRVTKRVINFPGKVDRGMVEWARTYLNELMQERMLTERLVRRALDNPELEGQEAGFVRSLAPAFDELWDEQSAETLYVGGATRVIADSRFQDVAALQDLLRLLEERYLLLRLLRSVLAGGKVTVSIGDENGPEVLHNFSLVAATYGLPQRNLGTVSLLGPLRMDYEAAITTVRSTARLLSSFLEDRYE